MLDLLTTVAAFFGGIWFGKAQAVNQDITKQTEHMQDLIDQAYEKRDHMKRMWLDAEEKAESWERRYYNLIEDINAEEESEVGS